MYDWIFALGSALLFSGALIAVSVPQIPAWTERGFVNLLLPWKQTFLYGTVSALIASALTVGVGGEWWQGGLLGLLAWMLVFSVVTDYATYKIPFETSVAAYLLPLVIAVPLTWGDNFAYISAGIWFGMTVLLSLLSKLMGGGLGHADMRLFYLMGTSLSWWVGIDWMFYAFGASAALQLAVFTASRITGWGRIKPAGAANTLSREESKAFKEQQRVAKEQNLEIPKGRKVLPFGPAIVATFLAMAIWAAAEGHNACSAYGGLICL